LKRFHCTKKEYLTGRFALLLPFKRTPNPGGTSLVSVTLPYVDILVNATLMDLREKKKTWTWDHISKRRKMKEEYIPLYRKIKVNIKLTPDEQLRFDKLESDLPLDDIL
jgi:hypothetical protein